MTQVQFQIDFSNKDVISSLDTILFFSFHLVFYGCLFVSKFNDCSIYIQRGFHLYSTTVLFIFNGVSFIFNDCSIYIQRVFVFIQRLLTN